VVVAVDVGVELSITGSVEVPETSPVLVPSSRGGVGEVIVSGFDEYCTALPSSDVSFFRM
jgi:hypothetical protein